MPRTDARAAMIDAAERIVGERGLDALTLRDVQIESGQANKSAAQYHFGSRRGLLEAVIEERMRPVDEHRRRMLDDLDRRGRPATRRELVEALVRPLADATVRRRGSHYARFAAQAIYAPELFEVIDKHLRAESFRATWQRLAAASALPRSVTEHRLGNVMLLCLAALAAREAQRRSRAETDLIVTDLIDTCVAILDAPSTIATEGA
jgi:AcrR family transcriptional regulator